MYDTATYVSVGLTGPNLRLVWQDQTYDDDKSVDANYLDFRKAFDTVLHKRLLYKLNHFGVRGHVLAWIGGSHRKETKNYPQKWSI